MSAEFPWVKVYLELPTDPKLLGRSAHDRYLWVCLILLARGNVEAPGTVPLWQARVQYLSQYTGIRSQKEIVDGLNYFEAVGMVALKDGEIRITRFSRRQGGSDPKAAERMRNSREHSRTDTERSRNVTPNIAEHSANISERSANVTRNSYDIRAREDRNPNGLLKETEKERERDAHPRARSRPVLEEERAWADAEERGYNRTEATELLKRFRDRADAKGWRDKDGPWRDHNARFRTYLTRAPEWDFPPSGAKQGGPSRDPTAEEVEALAAQIRAEREALLAS